MMLIGTLRIGRKAMRSEQGVLGLQRMGGWCGAKIWKAEEGVI